MSAHARAGALLGLAALIAAGCAAAQRPPATANAAGPSGTTPDAARAPARSYSTDEARALYVARCGMCHRGNGMAVGLLARRLPADQAVLENREDLDAAYVETVVRTGVLNMPPLSRAEVSEPELAAIARYLEAGPHETE